MKTFKKIGLTVGVLVASINANPWTECGIGGAIGSLVKDNQAASKVIASVSNIIWDLGTTATTSAVSTPDLCANNQVAAAKFINDTYASLENETANGQGENLTALFNIMSCDGSSHAELINTIRPEIGMSIGSESYSTSSNTEKAQAYYGVFMKAVSENSSCEVI